jgi:hypothetical protein
MYLRPDKAEMTIFCGMKRQAEKVSASKKKGDPRRSYVHRGKGVVCTTSLG